MGVTGIDAGYKAVHVGAVRHRLGVNVLGVEAAELT
jgi:hypothetical protein